MSRDTKVETEQGLLSGEAFQTAGMELHSYRGIPYAAPPIGELRWRPPSAPVSWSGIRACTRFSDSCAQLPVAWSGFDFPQSEDCLTLNILTAACDPSERLPVMVALHGGGYSVGSGNDRLYSLPQLATYGVVLVSVNTRLGVLGLLGHPLLSAESTHRVSGNYMLLDLVAALEWTKRNIEAFGGDPSNVTVFGSSGGSWKAIDLMVSPLAAGLFDKAACSSGTPWGTALARPMALDQTEATGAAFFAKLGLSGLRNPLAAARDLPWRTILQADGELLAEAGLAAPFSNWDISVDGFVLPDAPLEAFRAGKQNPMSLIVGGNLGEITEPIMPEIIPAYLQMLVSAAGLNTPGYAYIFDHVPSGWNIAGVPCTHGQELPYLFGDFDFRTSAAWSCAQMLNGAQEADPGITESDFRIADLLATMWTQFAKTGNPSMPSVIDWPEFELSTEPYLYIGHPLEIRQGLSSVDQVETD